MSNQGYYNNQPQYGGQPQYPPNAYGGPPPQQGYYQQGPPPQQMQYQQQPPPKSSGGGQGCLGGCLAALCCCCVMEEGCELCIDCAECLLRRLLNPLHSNTPIFTTLPASMSASCSIPLDEFQHLPHITVRLTRPREPQANNTTLSKVFAIRLVHLCQSYRLVHRLIPFKMIESKNSTFASASIHTFSFLSHPVFHIPGLRLFSDGWITQVFCFQLVFRDGWIWMVKIR
ncbi:hypothetical protein EYC84_011344 [Monilinia fructicola]|uniref:Cysteine-rich transmembrane domain-containing protein n=1 Tax=Monilinia fructicola TaxID=38448 RepID=A0A5M9J815_MONFR|nr:hypothetical protein EYC84_011344 [Monilinia fructicola]